MVEVAEYAQIVLWGIFGRSNRIFADVATDDDILVAVAEIRYCTLQAFARKTYAVEYCTVVVESPKARLRIARLWKWGDGADFDKTETERTKRIEEVAIAVETCGQTYRILEFQAKYFALQRGVFYRV